MKASLLIRRSVLVVCLSPLQFSSVSADPPAPQQPNIVLIMVDDLGVGEMQWYPAEADISARVADAGDALQTPNIFRLAQEGIRFTDYRAPAPSCSPSRAAILTGRYPQEFSIRDYLPDQLGRGLPAGTTTIASLLADNAGYLTGHFGKWHLGDSRVELLPVNFGFATSLSRTGNELLAGYKGSDFIHDDDIANAGPVNAGQHSSETITDAAIAFIDQAQLAGRPYFLNLWYRAPHNPIDPPADFPVVAQDKPSVQPASSWGLNWADLVAGIPELAPLADLQNHSPTADAKRRAMYIAMVAWLDYQIGRVIEHIDATDPSGTTLILFTSDNGAQTKPYASGSGTSPAKWEPNGDLSGQKGRTLEGGLRVPLILRQAASTTNAGRAFAANTVGYDLLPTMLEAAGQPGLATGLVGQSLIAALTNPQYTMVRAAPIFFESKLLDSGWQAAIGEVDLTTEHNNYAVLDDALDRKLVNDQLGGLSEPIDLFDTSLLTPAGIGVAEQILTNVASGEPATVALLETDYRAWRRTVGGIPLSFDAQQTTANLNGLCVEFDSVGETATLTPNELYAIRDADFSFQTKVLLDGVPGAGGAVVAEAAGSWGLYLYPGAAPGTLKAKLAVTGRDRQTPDYPGMPGDVVNLEKQFPCNGSCEFNLAFTVLGVPDFEPTIRLFVDGVKAAEYVGNGADPIDIREVWAGLSNSVSLGSAAGGQRSLDGKLADPRLFSLNLTVAEVGAVMLEQAAEACESGGCH